MRGHPAAVEPHQARVLSIQDLKHVSHNIPFTLYQCDVPEAICWSIRSQALVIVSKRAGRPEVNQLAIFFYTNCLTYLIGIFDLDRV